MKVVELVFRPFKTRTHLAKEMKVTPHFLKKKLFEKGIEIPPRQQISVEKQREIYICILGEKGIQNTPYENL